MPFVCISKGEIIGIDSNSGGYPWRSNYIQGYRFWNTREEAEKYASIWTNGANDSYGYSDMIVKEVELVFKP
jgi:hypothetical protein